MADQQQIIKKCLRCDKNYIIGGCGLCAECLDKDYIYLQRCNELARTIKHENPGLVPEGSEMIIECLQALRLRLKGEVE